MKRSPQLTFWQKAERFPPLLVRLLAKEHGKPITNAEIALASSLPYLTVWHLCQQLNWDGVDVPTMRRFLDGCRLDFEDPVQIHRAMMYMRGKKRKGLHVPPNFAYLRKDQDWESFFKPLIERFLRAESRVTHLTKEQTNE